MALNIIRDYKCIIDNVFNYRYRYIVYLSGRMGLAKSTNISAALLIAGCMKKLRRLCVRETQNSMRPSVTHMSARLTAGNVMKSSLIQSVTRPRTSLSQAFAAPPASAEARQPA